MKPTTATIGEAWRYPKSHGDLWSATWADDDALYVAADDTLGFDDSCRSNLAIHRLTGAPPEVVAETINPMVEYGSIGERKEIDNGMWKACGLIAVDGVLYMSVSRHTYPWDTFSVQRAWDSSVVTSSDYGRTWSPMPQIGKSMFPGYNFATPFFVQYGRDGQWPDVDGSAHYVYAISNNGTWGDGDFMTLGRVARDQMSRLDPEDWEFLSRFDKEYNPIWQSRHDTAGYVFRDPGRTSMTGIHYIAALDRYIMPQWHHNKLDDAENRWKSTSLVFYHSDAPWGPWTRFHSQEYHPEGWYNPCIPLKYVSSDGRRMWLLVSGDWTTAKRNDAMYGLFMLPMEIHIGLEGTP